MMTVLVIFSFGLLIGLYLNWRILQVTRCLLDETTTIRKDTKVIRQDTRRVADSFDVQLPVQVYPKS